jgi:phospholipid/cholesterol/gamma-HCH transport system substrate-binding protein
MDESETESESETQTGTESKRARRSARMLEIQAGAFVVLLLLIGLGTVTVLSEKRHVFEREVVLHAAFREIQGLKEGAPVRISGVNVGAVSRIDFIARDGKPLVEVDLKIARSQCRHVRTDSVARIDAQGLLGDKLIEITAGSPSQPPVSEGATLVSSAPADLDQMMRTAGETLDRVKLVADQAAVAMQAIADPKMLDDLHASMSSLRGLMAATEKGNGLAHALFYDPRTARELSQLTEHVDQLVAHVDDGVTKVDGILAATDGNGRQLVNNLSSAARGVGALLGDVQRTQLVSNLSKASGDLAYLTAYTRAGKGSIGGALIDPVAYEQLVTILGGVNRSRTLRALVRYAISQDEGSAPPKTVGDKK